MGTIALWVCIYSIRYYAPNYVQVAAHHMIIHLGVNAVNLATTIIGWYPVGTLMLRQEYQFWYSCLSFDVTLMVSIPWKLPEVTNYFDTACNYNYGRFLLARCIASILWCFWHVNKMHPLPIDWYQDLRQEYQYRIFGILVSDQDAHMLMTRRRQLKSSLLESIQAHHVHDYDQS